MKVKVIHPVIANGAAHEAGSVIEVSDYDARQLIAMKRAVKFAGEPVAKKEDKPEPEARPKVGYRKKGSK